MKPEFQREFLSEVQGVRAALAAEQEGDQIVPKPNSQELLELWNVCNSPSVFASQVISRWGHLSQSEKVSNRLTDEEILNLSSKHQITYTLLDGRTIYPLTEGHDNKADVLSFARAIEDTVLQSVGPFPVLPQEDLDRWLAEPETASLGKGTLVTLTTTRLREVVDKAVRWGYNKRHPVQEHFQ